MKDGAYMKKLFNDNWQFLKTEIDREYSDALTDNGWKAVEIPHDWLIFQTKNLYETSCGWYRKSFTADNSAECVRLRFDGVYMNCAVYVNGKIAGEWKYGYSSFEFDITKLLKNGENLIVVQVRHNAPNSRWYSGAGIYRNIHLIESRKAHIASDGVYFSEKADGENRKVRVFTELSDCENGVVIHTLLDENGAVFAQSTGGAEQEFTVKQPLLWDTDAPHLYTLKTELSVNGQTVDETSCKVGFRTIEFRSDSGFFLNGRHVKLNGICNHHDLGSLGAAVNATATRRQLEIMKAMGVNALRTSHNMPSVELMELCDEMGILVDSEAFDIWELKKTDYDYARFFDDWYKQDVQSWVRRDRNHPSVIMWSIGNEIYDTHVSKRGIEVTEMLIKEVRRWDFLCNAYTTSGSNYIAWENAQLCSDKLEVQGYNYGEHLYEKHHEIHPDWCIYGSETAARVQSRGIYHFPASAAFLTHDDEQCSSLGNCRAGISDRTAQTSIIADRDTPYSAGQFIWTGFDYLGEPSPYFTKNSYYGQADTAGFLKDSYYLYKAAWTDETVLHLFPHWDWNDGQLIDIFVYTNQPETELFLNGRSLGRVKTERYSAHWQQPYEKGVLKAVSYNENGEITATDETRSFGDTAWLALTPDKTEIRTDGEDLIFIDISAYDCDDIFVLNARNRVNVTVTGAGRLVGLDSGDSTDYDEYKSTSKKLFGGKLLAIIAAKDIAGNIDVKVNSDGLPECALRLKVVSAGFPDGASRCFTENTVPEITEEKPVRKIELKADRQMLDSDNRTAEIYAKVYPENAEYEIEWIAVTETGVKTNIAEVEANGSKAAVTAKGDGEFRLRAFSRNGKEKPEVISELEMRVENMGNAAVNPYEKPIKGSLYSESPVKLDEVANGGVSIARGGRNAIGFRNVCFGENGAKTLTVSIINWHNNDPVPFALWSGFPWEKNAVKLGEFTYRADFIWQTYIENTFTLPEILRVTADICFDFEESDKRVSFGSFIFGEYDRTYEINSAASFTSVHGDKFSVNGGSVEHIGNNVFIEYEGFDFTHGAAQIKLCGRTRNINDSLHLQIVSDTEIKRFILEVPQGIEYSEFNYPLENVSGKCKVRFQFLPGCDFDFESFRFISE